VLYVYGDKLKDWDDFEKRFAASANKCRCSEARARGSGADPCGARLGRIRGEASGEKSRCTLQPAAEGDFGADVIDGLAENSDQAATKIHQTIEALLTFPFFGGEKLVWLKNANFSAIASWAGPRRPWRRLKTHRFAETRSAGEHPLSAQRDGSR
jgi:hypothetical protein